MKLSKTALVFVGFVALLVGGCGKNSKFDMVKDVAVKSLLQDGQAYGQVKVGLDTGNILLPAFQLPIFDPRNPKVVFGSVGMRPRLDGKTELEVDLNLTELAQIPGSGALLPNGTSLPIGGLDNLRVLDIVITNGIHIYAAIDFNMAATENAIAMIGVAIPFREMDSVGNYVGGADLFAGFNFGPVKGVAGIFASNQSNKTGIGLFLDASELLRNINVQKGAVVAQNSGFSVASFALSSPAPVHKLTFYDVVPGSRQHDRLNNAILQLHQRRARMHLN